MAVARSSVSRPVGGAVPRRILGALGARSPVSSGRGYGYQSGACYAALAMARGPAAAAPAQSKAVRALPAAECKGKGYKMKTKSSAKKRFRVTPNGKVMMRKPQASPLEDQHRAALRPRPPAPYAPVRRRELP